MRVLAMKIDEEPDTGFKEPKDSAKEYTIAIFMAWCKSCGICVAFCPRNCLEQDEEGSPVITRPELCTGCGWCEIHCPDFAISVRQKEPGEQKKIEEAE